MLRVQELLSALQIYHGPVDSSYGGGTFAAVKTYQKEHGLPLSGTVDFATWACMFPREPQPVSSLSSQPLSERCLALTGSFETSSYPPESFCGLSGDFDGMGISFGACQWNIGQGTLQPLLHEMFEEHSEVAGSVFHEFLEVLAAMRDEPLGDQLSFARSIQHKGTVNEPWRGMLLALGRTPEFQQIQTNAAQSRFKAALQLCDQFELESERAAALLFDVVVQNGSISNIVKKAIHLAFLQLSADRYGEEAKMGVIANHVATASDPRYTDDVRRRKLVIAQGSGVLHGRYYDLDDAFGIGLRPFSR